MRSLALLVVAVCCLLLPAVAQSNSAITGPQCTACSANSDSGACGTTGQLHFCGLGQSAANSSTDVAFCCLDTQSCAQWIADDGAAPVQAWQCLNATWEAESSGALTSEQVKTIAVAVPVTIVGLPLFVFLVACVLACCCGCKHDPARLSPARLAVMPSVMVKQPADLDSPTALPSAWPCNHPLPSISIPPPPPLAPALDASVPSIPPPSFEASLPLAYLPPSDALSCLLATRFGPLFHDTYAILDPSTRLVVAFQHTPGETTKLFRLHALTLDAVQALARQHSVQQADALNTATVQRLAPLLQRHFPGRVVTVCCGVVLQLSPLVEELNGSLWALDEAVRARTTYAPVTPAVQPRMAVVVQ